MRAYHQSGTQEEGELLEVDLKVDALGAHGWVPLQLCGRKVEDALDATVSQILVALLGRRFRHREDGDLGIGLRDDLWDFPTVMNGQIADFVAYLPAVHVEGGDDPEGLVVDAEVSSQSAAETSHADDCQTVDTIEPEEGVETFGEIVDPIARAPDAELAELCEILANQWRGEFELLGELTRGDVGYT